MRAAIYARVSTIDQTCDLQLRELRQYIAARGWETTGEYVDTGWSGAAAARPELDRLLADARLRRFDVVLVWKLDRCLETGSYSSREAHTSNPFMTEHRSSTFWKE